MVTYKLTKETLLNLGLGEHSDPLFKVTLLLREQIIKTKGLYKTLDLCNKSDDESDIALTRFNYNTDIDQEQTQRVLDDLMDQLLSPFPDCLLGEPEYFIYTANESLHISFNDHSLDLIYHSTGQW